MAVLALEQLPSGVDAATSVVLNSGRGLRNEVEVVHGVLHACSSQVSVRLVLFVADTHNHAVAIQSLTHIRHHHTLLMAIVLLLAKMIGTDYKIFFF